MLKLQQDTVDETSDYININVKPSPVLNILSIKKNSQTKYS